MKIRTAIIAIALGLAAPEAPAFQGPLVAPRVMPRVPGGSTPRLMPRAPWPRGGGEDLPFDPSTGYPEEQEVHRRNFRSAREAEESGEYSKEQGDDFRRQQDQYHRVCDNKLPKILTNDTPELKCKKASDLIRREQECIRLRRLALKDHPRINPGAHSGMIQGRQTALEKAFDLWFKHCHDNDGTASLAAPPLLLCRVLP